MSDWELAERMPRYDDINLHQVWVFGQVRSVRRVGNRSTFYTPGTLVFTDCTHPMQQAICDDELVNGWRIAPQTSP